MTNKMDKLISRTIYLVQQKKIYGRDETDNEAIEERMIIGYFSSLELVAKVKKLCLENGVPEEQIYTEEYKIKLNCNQNCLYVLSHTYSLINKDGSYTDYEYIFEPKSSKNKCERLKKKLCLEDKYKFSSNRNYDVQPPDGFLISEYELDCMWYPIFKKM